MGYQIYEVGPRWGGYGVPAICEQPGCNEKIDRGMAYACGGEPFSELGCDRYFCGKHLEYECWKCDGSEEKCDHDNTKKNCSCMCAEVCERCAKGEPPFPYKPETKEWIKHLLKDPSWKEWRENNNTEVEELKKQYEKIYDKSYKKSKKRGARKG